MRTIERVPRRRYPTGGERALMVEVSEDDAFRKVLATAQAVVSRKTDWTSRVLAGGLKPGVSSGTASTDREGAVSRIVEAKPFSSPDFPEFVPEEAMEILWMRGVLVTRDALPFMTIVSQ